MAGNYLGIEYTNPIPPGEAYSLTDGTTDGTYNYSVGVTSAHDPSGQWLYRFDRSWANWEAPFDVRLGGSTVSAITYEPQAQELLVAKSMTYGDDPYWRKIHKFTRGGTFLGDIILDAPSEGPNLSYMSALAMDVDGTLWFMNDNGGGLRGYLYHYATNGNYLGRQYYSELDMFAGAQQTPLGGEISAVPEPSSWLLAAAGLLTMIRRRA